MAVFDLEMEAPAMVKQQKERERTERTTERNEEEEEVGSHFNILYIFLPTNFSSVKY